MKSSFLIVLGCFLFACTVRAQTDSLHLPKRFYVYADLELGGSQGDVYWQFSLAVQQNNNYLRLKGSDVFQLNFGNKPLPGFGDIALIAGKSYTLGKCHNFKLGTGLALTHYRFDIGYGETIKKETIGLPVEVKYCYMIGWTAGFSLSFQHNFNKLKSYNAITAGLAFGFLRERKNSLKR